MFINTNSVNLCQNSVSRKIVGMSKIRFSKRKLHFLFCLCLCWIQRNRKKKKTKWKKAQKTIKIVFFKGGNPKMRNMKKIDFFKNCLTLFVTGKEKNAHFRAHYLFWPKTFLGPKQWKPGKTIKDSGCSGNCPKPKMTPFFEKGVLWHGWKIGFYSVFEKLCFIWKHYFYSVFSKTQQLQQKNCMLKKTENIMKNSGLFMNMAKWCFFGFGFFEVLMVLWCVLCVSGIVSKVLKMFVFPKCLGAFAWWPILVYLGLEGLGVSLVLVFVFLLFRVLFMFVLALGFVLLLDCCWCCSCLVLFFVFVSFSFVFCFCSLEGLRVKWSGPKGHLTWP